MIPEIETMLKEANEISTEDLEAAADFYDRLTTNQKKGAKNMPGKRYSDNDTCLYPPCKRKPKARGLCEGHYQCANDAVRRKETTWEELVKKGKALDASYIGSGIRNWLLED